MKHVVHVMYKAFYFVRTAGTVFREMRACWVNKVLV